MSFDKESSETAIQISVASGNATDTTSYSVYHETPVDVFRLEGDMEAKEYLKSIVQLLERAELSGIKEERKERRKIKNAGQFSSAFCVVAIFLASLGAAFLSYAHDVFSNRESGTPAKITDNIVNALWFIAILFSLVATILLAFAASGVASHLEDKIRRIIHSVRDLENQRARTIRGSENNRATNADARHGGRPGIRSMVDALGVDEGDAAELFISWFAIAFNLVPSLTALILGMMVFVWAEQPRSVAIALSASWGYLLFYLGIVCGWAAFMQKSARLLEHNM